ncbi:P-loop containing nucleoside triphosphate hydrolase protein, partial [Scenedesmus sp. NREL 46B-D3]
QILFSVTGEMLPGEMLALMGPSGSGKTSLLSIISGRAPKAVTTSGRVTSNGARFTKAAKRRVGFVLQDDLLYESLTVWETLGYAAALRLPRGTSAAQRGERVEASLLALGLSKCRHTIIGGFFRRGISGGERKRVSIGHELLINPAILMLDEPTSGLDSTTALHLLVTLRQLALGGRAVATTIHQPSSRLYQQLDKLMLLAEGHVMYYGSADQVVSWFSTLGFAMPYGVNVADFLLDLAQGELGRSITRIWSRSTSTSNVFAAGPADVEAGVGSAGGAQRGCAGALAGGLGLADRGGAGYSTQLRVLLQRHIKVKRFESLSSQRFLQGVIVALITGMFWWQRGRGGSLLAASDVVGLLFFELLFPAFTAMFTSLFTFPNDYRMLLKERASGMYRVSAFYLSSAVSDLPMDCALPALFVVIIYFMGGLRLTATAFLSNLAALVLNVLVAQSMGLLLGVAFMNPKTAQTVASIIMLGFMLVGGYYVRGIPAWISWIRYLSFVYWGFNLLLKIEFAGATYYSCGSSGLGTLDGAAAAGPSAEPCQAVSDLQAALQLPTDTNESPALEVGVLLAMLVLLRLMVYHTLRQKTKAA